MAIGREQFAVTDDEGCLFVKIQRCEELARGLGTVKAQANILRLQSHCNARALPYRVDHLDMRLCPEYRIERIFDPVEPIDFPFSIFIREMLI